MAEFRVYPVELASGAVAISPMPGAGGNFDADLATILSWNPALVLTMTTDAELRAAGATDLPIRLHEAGIGWLHLPIVDFREPIGETADNWSTASQKARDILATGGRVLAHCWGGHGRSGIAALRLMVEMGEAPDAALKRLRAVRPGAVETGPQMDWAMETGPNGN